MAKVFNKVGTISTLKAELHRRNIHQFHSVREIQAFEREFDDLKASILQKSRKALLTEKDQIFQKIEEIEFQIESKRKAAEQFIDQKINIIENRINFLEEQRKYVILKAISPILISFLKVRCNRISYSKPQYIRHSIRQENDDRERLEKRFDEISNNLENIVISVSSDEIQKLVSAKSAIDDVQPLIYGAIGESKVSSTLSELPDDYIVINDVNVKLSKPLYMKSENDRIFSFQIDHVVVGPTGIFAIETKHWSKTTIEKADFFSPIKQIRRSGFALFRMLNSAIHNGELSLTGTWGDRSVSVRNVLVLTASYEKKKFQHVKIIDLSSLNGYIQWFEKEIGLKEVQSISSYIRHLIQ